MYGRQIKRSGLVHQHTHFRIFDTGEEYRYNVVGITNTVTNQQGVIYEFVGPSITSGTNKTKTCSIEELQGAVCGRRDCKWTSGSVMTPVTFIDSEGRVKGDPSTGEMPSSEDKEEIDIPERVRANRVRRNVMIPLSESQPELRVIEGG